MLASHLLSVLEMRDDKDATLNKPSHQPEKINHDNVGPHTTIFFWAQPSFSHKTVNMESQSRNNLSTAKFGSALGIPLIRGGGSLPYNI